MTLLQFLQSARKWAFEMTHPGIDLSKVCIPVGFYVDESDMWYRAMSTTSYNQYWIPVLKIDTNWTGSVTTVEENLNNDIKEIYYVLKLHSSFGNLS